MAWRLAVTTTFLAASRACLATGEYEMSLRALSRGDIILGTSDVLERSYVDVSSGHYLHSGPLERRQNQNQQFESTVRLNPDGTIDMEAWDAETEAACQEALGKLQIASNPSGACICYNLPSLDTSTGVFEADLRVYRFNEPSGAFRDIAPQNIEVGLMYQGASVSPVTEETVANAARTSRKMKRQEVAEAEADAEEEAEEEAIQPAEGQLPLLQHYLFIGQIDSSEMSDDMTMAQLEALVMPILTLTGVNSTGQTVSTNVSSNEAVFVTGVFSREVVMSDFAQASAAVEQVIQQMKNKQVAFVLPGVRLMVYPIGLIITSVWLLLGLIAYGIGTYDRIGYAESFKRRTAIAGSSGTRI